MKALLWFLGSAAILNVIADLWFRLSIAGAPVAPWYVWGPVIGTVAVVFVSLGGKALAKSRQARAKERDALLGIVPVVGPVHVEYVLVPGQADDRAARTVAGRESALRLEGETGKPWRAVSIQRTFQRDARWRYDVACEPAPTRVDEEAPAPGGREHEAFTPEQIWRRAVEEDV